MSSLVNMEFLTNPSEFEDFSPEDFSSEDFSLGFSLDFNDEVKSIDEHTSLEVTGSNDVAMYYNYTSNLDEDSGKANKTTYLELTNKKGTPDFTSKNNLAINKIEFDRENGRPVSVKVEFQADTEENAKEIKDKVKAYGIAVK